MAKTKEVTVKEEVDVLGKYSHLTTKSSKIRAMASDGLTRSQISKLLDIRYQHVRNVLIQPLKKAQ